MEVGLVDLEKVNSSEKRKNEKNSYLLYFYIILFLPVSLEETVHTFLITLPITANRLTNNKNK